MNPNFTFNTSLVAIYLNRYQIELIRKGTYPKNLLDAYFGKIRNIFGNLPIFINCHDPNFLSEYNFLQPLGAQDETMFLNQIYERLPKSTLNDPDIDEVFFAYFQGIFPFLDTGLTNELLGRHTKYLSQYSYSENLPPGIVPTFVSREFLREVPPGTPSIHDFLIKNINHYDTEIFYIAPDLRQLRLDFSLKDERSLLMSGKVFEANPSIQYSQMQKFFLENTDVFRLGPSYMEIEIINDCQNACIFCPRSNPDTKMPVTQLEGDFFRKLTLNLGKQFGMGVTFCLGGLGEPLLHTNLSSILSILLDFQYLQEIIIETSLYPDINNLLDFLKTINEAQKEKISFIINLTTLKAEKYKEIYKSESSLDTILEKVHLLKETHIKKNVHVQFLKIAEVEEELDEYFDFFEQKEGLNVILQKYNSYAKLLPERRTNDLTPIKREFCWHLARDVYINANGDVSVCKQAQKNVIGNLYNQDLHSIWNKGHTMFSYSMNGKHEKIDAPCLDCDEWYTFNA